MNPVIPAVNDVPSNVNQVIDRLNNSIDNPTTAQQQIPILPNPIQIDPQMFNNNMFYPVRRRPETLVPMPGHITPGEDIPGNSGTNNNGPSLPSANHPIPRFNTFDPTNRPIWHTQNQPGTSTATNVPPVLNPAPPLPSIVRDIERELAQVLDIYPGADPLWIRYMMQIQNKSIDNVIDRLVRGDGVFGTGFVPPHQVNDPNVNVPTVPPSNNVNGANNVQPQPQPLPQQPVDSVETVLEVCGNSLDPAWIKNELRSVNYTVLIDRIFNGELTPKRKPTKSHNSSFGSPSDGQDESADAGYFSGNVYGPDVDAIFNEARFFDRNDVDTVMNEMRNAFDAANRINNVNRDLVRSASHQLKYEFPFLYGTSIEAVLRRFNFSCAPAYVVLAMAQDQLKASHNWSVMKLGKISFTADPITVCDQTFTNVLLRVLSGTKRVCRSTADPQLERSIELAQVYPKCVEAYERLVKERKEAQKDEIPLDCPICCDSVIMDACVQCHGGHLVCLACLAGVVEQKVSGQCSSDLICLTSENDCELSYSDATLKRLPRKLYMRYAKRVRQEQLAIAYDEDGLEQCPGCGTQVEINIPSEVDRVLNCVVCKRQTCRICNEPWDEVHFGKKCIELEKDDETKKRKKYEEMMTNAAVRACYKCKQNIIKEEGCNKMTCRCGATFCYLCRVADISDDHFCRHFIEEGTLCAEACGKCRLFEDPKTKDLEKLVEIQQKAKVEFGGDRIIGFDLSSTIVKKT